ncbi:DUF7009 family protein [Mucilaginibacter lappiensis]|uniref:DUF7009 family protein n=1 Tax=Mucilaginibacter lappiensis TaxID=354630 RepID=UPI003D1B88B4
MKIRIKGNSLRYRLTRTDVDRLDKESYLEEQTNFSGNRLVYAIQLTKSEVLISTFIDYKITLSMPHSMLEELIHTDKVGFSNRDGDIQILVEKDFTCLDNVAEDQSDNYPNPLANKQYEQGK